MLIPYKENFASDELPTVNDNPKEIIEDVAQRSM